MEQKKYPIPKEIDPDHQQLMTEIGERIKKLRVAKGMQLTVMAKLIGLHRNEYSMLENGNLYFKFSTLLRILDYHKISFSDFIRDI